MGGADRSDGPGVAPAVAMEHWQRPEVDAVGGHPVFQQLAKGIEIGAAMGVHHPLRAAGRAAGVVNRDRLVLVGDRPIERIGAAAGQEGLVVDARQPDPTGDVLDVDDRLDRLQIRQHRFNDAGQLGVYDKDLGPRVVQDVADLLRVQPGVDGHQNPTGERHSEMAFQQCRDVRDQIGDAVPLLHPRRAKRRGEPVHPCRQFGVGPGPIPVHDSRLLTKDRRAALKEAQRG